MNTSTLSRAHALTRTRPLPYLEAVAMVLALWALDRVAVPESAGFLGWIVDPYLLPVLLIAARYGLVAGLFTAFLAAGARLASTLAEVGSLTAMRFLAPETVLPDLALVAVALIAGGLSDRVRGVIRELLIGVEALQARFDRLSTQYTLLQDEKHVLDSHVLSEEETFEGVTAMFDKLDRARTPDVARDVLELAVHLMGGGEAALYEIRRDWRDPAVPAAGDVAVHDGHAGVLVATGRGDWPRALPLDNPVVAHALTARGPVSLAQVSGWRDLDAFTVAAVHLACPFHSHQHAGQLVLVMRELPFVAFSPARLRALGRTLRVACRHLDRGKALRRLRADRDEARVHRAASSSSFQERVRDSFAKAERTGGHVFLIRVGLAGPDVITGTSRGNLRRRLERFVSREVAAGRLIAHQTGIDALSVLCPAFDRASAEAYRDQLDARLARIPVPVSVGDHGHWVRLSLLELDPKDSTPAAGGSHA